MVNTITSLSTMGATDVPRNHMRSASLQRYCWPLPCSDGTGKRLHMIELAIGALIIGIIASLLGFTGIAGVSYAIAKVIGVVFLLLFLVLLMGALAVF
jgi:uncharacterized membrane protein YtjA (UPF0391 family)